MELKCVTVIFCILGATAIAFASVEEPPKWPPVYIVEGSLHVPTSDIEEPFKAWYDSIAGRSRIDYYGGTVKTYQVPGQPHGEIVHIEVMPVSNGTVNFMYQFYVEDPGTLNIQPALPETKNMEFAGSETFMSVKCDRYTMKIKAENRLEINTLWVQYINPANQSTLRVPVPKRFDRKVYTDYNVFEHFYIDYYYLDPGHIPADVFEISIEKDGQVLDSELDFGINPMGNYIQYDRDHLSRRFQQFLFEYNKSYATATEAEYRRDIFYQNLLYIQSKNRANLGYTLAVNRFADLTQDEMKAFLGRRPSTRPNSGKPFPYQKNEVEGNFPEQLDWRLSGAVTPIKDQSMCGSCWAFGTVGAVEGAYFMKTNKSLRLSEQAVMDCSWAYGPRGCFGGSEVDALSWIKAVGGIPSDEEYGPYLAMAGYCHLSNMTLRVPIADYYIVPRNDPDALKFALFKHGPVIVGIESAKMDFSFYKSGVYSSGCSNMINHNVLAVGYGVLNGKPYWLVKNSWGIDWGNGGYILMSAEGNTCCILRQPVYVTM